MKRWQQRAQALLATARSNHGAADSTEKAAADRAGLRGHIEASLLEVEGELKVSGVPEAVELSGLLQVRGAGVRRVLREGMSQLGGVRVDVPSEVCQGVGGGVVASCVVWIGIEQRFCATLDIAQPFPFPINLS